MMVVAYCGLGLPIAAPEVFVRQCPAIEVRPLNLIREQEAELRTAFQTVEHAGDFGAAPGRAGGGQLARDGAEAELGRWDPKAPFDVPVVNRQRPPGLRPGRPSSCCGATIGVHVDGASAGNPQSWYN